MDLSIISKYWPQSTMKTSDWSNLFYSILDYVGQYPSTLFNLLFFPRKMLGPNVAQNACPAGIFFFISAVFGYVASFLLGRASSIAIGNPDESVETVPFSLFIVGGMVYVAVIVQIQRYFLRKFFNIYMTEETKRRDFDILTYPFSVTMSLTAFFMLVQTVLLVRMDSVWHPNSYVVFPVVIFIHSSYIIVLHNLLRINYKISMIKSVVSSASMYLCLLIIIFVVIWLFRSGLLNM